MMEVTLDGDGIVTDNTPCIKKTSANVYVQLVLKSERRVGCKIWSRSYETMIPLLSTMGCTRVC